MPHALNLISHDSRIARQWHMHRCPICKRFKWEANLICQKSADHTYPCMTCMNDWRTRFGMEVLVDAVVGAVAPARSRPPTAIKFNPETMPRINGAEVREMAAGLGPEPVLIAPTQALQFMREWKDEKLEVRELVEAQITKRDIVTGEPLKRRTRKHPAT